MHRLLRRTLPAVALALSATAAQAQFTVYGITAGPSGQQLVRFGSNTPGAVATVGATGANLSGLDFRPATGQLFGFDGTQIFTLSLANGAATPVGATGTPITGNAGFDFNPTVDLIRIVGSGGTNLRANPTTGVAVTDGSLAYVAGDAAFGNSPFVTGVAYTNNDNDPGTGTTLYGVDARRGTLVRFESPNAGTLVTVGSLGLGFDATVNGFDVVTTGGSNVAFLAAVRAGTPTVTSLYTVNLTTGATAFVGDVGGGVQLQGIAVVPTVSPVPEPATFGLVAAGLGIVGVLARRRRTLG